MPKFGNIFFEYLGVIGKEAEVEEFFTLMFTNFNYPDTVIYIAFEDEEVVGFLWADPITDHMWIKEIYSKAPGAGNAMMTKLRQYSKKEGFDSIKGMVGAYQADAMMRHFDMQIEAYLLVGDLNG